MEVMAYNDDHLSILVYPEESGKGEYIVVDKQTVADLMEHLQKWIDTSELADWSDDE